MYNQFEQDSISYEFPLTLPTGLTITNAIPGAKIDQRFYLASIIRSNVPNVPTFNGFHHVSPFVVVGCIESIRDTIDKIIKAQSEDIKPSQPESNECCICIDAVATHTNMPCNHKCLCENCATKSDWAKLAVKSCPLCRGLVVTIENK